MRSSFTSDVYRHIHVRSRGYLPHWEIDGGTYFVTFRTADSLAPQHVSQLQEERRALEKQIDMTSSAARQQLASAMLMRIDTLLDSGYGSQPLHDPRLAKIVAEAIRFFDRSRYELLTWCVMPNHVHVLAQLTRGTALDSVLQSWKSYTAKKINNIRSASGKFWAREYYDHVARDPEEVLRIDRYIRENPLKAGLKDWPWVGSKLRVPPAGRRRYGRPEAGVT